MLDLFQLAPQFVTGRLDQNRSIRKDDGGNAAVAAIHLFDDAGAIRILIDIDVFVRKPVGVELAFREKAISTSGGCVHANWLC